MSTKSGHWSVEMYWMGRHTAAWAQMPEEGKSHCRLPFFAYIAICPVTHPANIQHIPPKRQKVSHYNFITIHYVCIKGNYTIQTTVQLSKIKT